MLLEFLPARHFGAEIALPFLGIVCLFFATMFFLILREALSSRRRAKASEDYRTLNVGAGSVAGEVELAQGEFFAARIEVMQRGRNKYHRGNASHIWREEWRADFSRPFWIRHESGERIFVPECGTIHLVDKLDRTIHDEKLSRYRIAELSAGEFVVAEGKLSRKQIAPPGEPAREYWVFEPGNLEPLRLSAESLTERHARKASRFSLAALGAIALWLWSLAMFAPFLGQYTAGEVKQGDMTGRRNYVRRTRHGSEEHFELQYWLDGVNHTGEVRARDYAQINAIGHVPVMVGPFGNSLGGRPSMSLGRFMGVVLGIGLLLGLFFYVRRKEWWESDCIIERGRGEIPQPSPRATSGTLMSRPH